ncbi:mpv17-like protein isoform X1 [Megalobrama amblycephala]|uniref:mpv17-like protein isoform X1 n=1 Tax=Megalobrama amblycephala TaxID=75352 RepID=UPI002013E0DE|nr:mpv17-like protein isoform X1 [Megalobrama amblycephala]
MRDALLKPVRRFPWATNVTLYGCLFAGGDFVHQLFSRKEQVDWSHTRNVAVVAFSFHGNFNFFWMRFLERRFPGNSLRMVLRKLLLDQTLAAPLAISAFYTGVSFMEGRDEILQDWKEKFLNTYKTGLTYWPFMQCSSWLIVPEFHPGSTTDPHCVHRLLWIHLGYVPLLFPPERRWNHDGSSGLDSWRRAQTRATEEEEG